MPESSGSAAAATAAPAAADKDSPPVVEGGEDCILSSRNRSRGSQGKKRARAKTCEDSARQPGAVDDGGAPESEEEGGDLMMPAPRVSQKGGGGASQKGSGGIGSRLGEHAAPRLNQRQVRAAAVVGVCRDAFGLRLKSLKQAAAERIDCADFEPAYALGHRSLASTSTSAGTAAAADEIDRLNRSVKQHFEKIRFDSSSLLLHTNHCSCNRTLEMDLTKSNQEVAMLRLQNGRPCALVSVRSSLDPLHRQQRASENSRAT
jgi:hypothetical protein